MESILNLYSSAKGFTYVGIGSCPHDPLDKITEKWDQVLPVFIMDILKNTTTTLRIIHFDPQFTLEFMSQYFKTKLPDLSLTITNEYWVWSNSRVEIIISKEPLYHTSKFEGGHESTDWFLKRLTNQILETGGKLVVQEFTGQELGETCKAIYHKLTSTEKSIFKKNVLFDITYGQACHCMTDMTQYKPLYTTNGDFYNFTLYSSTELKRSIGQSEKIDSLIFDYFYKQYAEILDGLHLIYRRNINKAENATDEDPDHVMALLQNKLSAMFPIFRALGVLTPEKEASLQRIFDEYREHNMYKWYSAVKDHLRPSVH